METFGQLSIKQTLLVFALVLLWGCEAAHPGKRCFTEEELEDGGDRVLRRNMYRTHSVEGAAPVPQLPHFSCPTDLYTKSREFSDRSVSPWRYRDDIDENRVPRLIQVAECLCKGCIVNGLEDATYNSVHVTQNMIVFRRHVCPHHPHKYLLTSQYVDVPVGCTCVLPK